MRILTALFLFAFPLSASATTAYDCVVTKRDGPFADRMSISFSSDQKAARIDDALVRHYEGQAVSAEVGEFTNKKHVAKWRITMTNRRGQTTKMTYCAVVLANGNLLLTAKPHGYTNNFTGRGRCRKV